MLKKYCKSHFFAEEEVVKKKFRHYVVVHHSAFQTIAPTGRIYLLENTSQITAFAPAVQATSHTRKIQALSVIEIFKPFQQLELFLCLKNS